MLFFQLPEVCFQSLFDQVNHFPPMNRGGNFQPLVQASIQIKSGLLFSGSCIYGKPDRRRYRLLYSGFYSWLYCCMYGLPCFDKLVSLPRGPYKAGLFRHNTTSLLSSLNSFAAAEAAAYCKML